MGCGEARWLRGTDPVGQRAHTPCSHSRPSLAALPATATTHQALPPPHPARPPPQSPSRYSCCSRARAQKRTSTTRALGTAGAGGRGGRNRGVRRRVCRRCLSPTPSPQHTGTQPQPDRMCCTSEASMASSAALMHRDMKGGRCAAKWKGVPGGMWRGRWGGAGMEVGGERSRWLGGVPSPDPPHLPPSRPTAQPHSRPTTRPHCRNTTQPHSTASQPTHPPVHGD